MLPATQQHHLQVQEVHLWQNQRSLAGYISIQENVGAAVGGFWIRTSALLFLFPQSV